MYVDEVYISQMSGAGFLLFDVEFVVEPEKLAKIKEVLAPQVQVDANRLGVTPVPDGRCLSTA
jgi:hypothetical protein